MGCLCAALVLSIFNFASSIYTLHFGDRAAIHDYNISFIILFCLCVCVCVCCIHSQTKLAHHRHHHHHHWHSN